MRSPACSTIPACGNSPAWIGQTSSCRRIRLSFPRVWRRPTRTSRATSFAAVRAGDILVHHPYESFAASVQRFIAQASLDPDVLSIKMTLYRTSGDSPIVHDLISAAERGKQVVVLVEIKARFDEQANIVWLASWSRPALMSSTALSASRPLQDIARGSARGREPAPLCTIGTGNYNSGTARLYTDLGLLSCRPELGADVSDLFNVLTGLSASAISDA